MKKLILFVFASILCACSGSSHKYVDINEIAALGIIDDNDKQGEIVHEKSFNWSGDFVGETINSKMKFEIYNSGMGDDYSKITSLFNQKSLDSIINDILISLPYTEENAKKEKYSFSVLSFKPRIFRFSHCNSYTADKQIIYDAWGEVIFSGNTFYGEQILISPFEINNASGKLEIDKNDFIEYEKL